MTTKERILDAALTLFSERGYGDVHVGKLPKPSALKHPHYTSIIKTNKTFSMLSLKR